MAETEDAVVDPGRVGFRDIYRAVNESEQRLTALIQGALGPFRLALDDHEKRLRDIESGGSREARDATELAQAALRKAEAVESLTLFFKNREEGIVKTLSFGQKIVLLIVGVVGALGVLSTLIEAAVK